MKVRGAKGLDATHLQAIVAQQVIDQGPAHEQPSSVGGVAAAAVVFVATTARNARSPAG